MSGGVQPDRTHDLVDLSHNLGGELVQDLDGLAVFHNLLRPGGARDDGCHVLVLEAPGERKLGL